MQAQRKHGYGAALAIIGRVVGELIIRGNMSKAESRKIDYQPRVLTQIPLIAMDRFAG